MNFGGLMRLTRLSLKRDLRGALSSTFGVTVGVASLVFFTALGLGISRTVRERVFPMDARLVEVVPSAVNFGAVLGGGTIDQSTVDRLRQIPGVQRVYRKMNVRVPAITRYDGDFFGRHLRMGLEVLAVGVDNDLVAKDVKMNNFEDAGPGQPIPSIAASRLLDIYNHSFAPNRGLPKLTGTLLLGFQFPVEFNRSFVVQARPGVVTEAKVQLVGVSDRGILAGLTIPLATAIRLNQASGADFESFTAVTLEVESPSQVPWVVSLVKEMGLKIDEQERRWAENMGTAVWLTTSALAFLSLLICVLAAVNIAHALAASVRLRVREFGVLRAVGASSRNVKALVLSEAAAFGLGGGVLGTASAVLMTWLFDRAAQSYLAEFPFKPESFFMLPWQLLGLGVVLGTVASLVGAYWPAKDAAAIDPARALAG
jgi:ABC-type antimicrobial peptide transport system permease subunit